MTQLWNGTDCNHGDQHRAHCRRLRGDEGVATPGGKPSPEEVSGRYLVSVPNDIVNKLMALRRPSESYSDVIVRLATTEHD
jgi:hypothetical protein